MITEIKIQRIRTVKNRASAFAHLTFQRENPNTMSYLAYQELFSLLHRHSTDAPEINYNVGVIPNKFIVKAPKTEKEKVDFRRIMQLLRLFNHALDVIQTDKGEKFYFIRLY